MNVAALLFLHWISLTWDAYPTAQHFSVYRAKAHTEKYVRHAQPKAPAWQDNNVVAGQTYCYYVTATIDKIETGPSNAVCVTVPKP